MSTNDVTYMDKKLAEILKAEEGSAEPFTEAEADSNCTKSQSNEVVKKPDEVIEEPAEPDQVFDEEPDEAVTKPDEVDNNQVMVNSDEEPAGLDHNQDKEQAESKQDEGLANSGADPTQPLPDFRGKAEDNMTKKVSTEGWEKPEPINTTVYLNQFPTRALPEPYRSYGKALAEEKAVPDGLAFLSVLGAISVALNGKYLVDAGRGGWKEQTNLYVLIADLPGRQKSQILEAVMEPVVEYCKSWNYEHKVDIRLSREHKERLEDKVRQQKSAYDKGKGSYEDYVKAVKEAEEFEPTRALELYVDNLTVEALAQTMEVNKGRISLVSSEGGMFDVIGNAYASNGAVNMNLLNKSYDGEPYSDRRVTRAGVNLEKPILTMMFLIQDGKLSEVLNNKSWIDNGFLNRWCFAKVSDFKIADDCELRPNMDENIRQDYFKAIKDLLADDNYQKMIRLEPDAALAFYDYFKKVKIRSIDPDDPLSNADGWGRKQAGRVLRLSGLLARANLKHLNEFTETEITVSSQVMGWAIQIGDYLTQEYVAGIDGTYCHSGGLFNRGDVDKALEIIASPGFEEFRPTDLHEKAYRFRNKTVRNNVLDYLEEKGYIKGLKKPGQKKVVRYKRNPLWLSQDKK